MLGPICAKTFDTPAMSVFTAIIFRPMEMSSKRPVPIIRQTHVPKKKVVYFIFEPRHEKNIFFLHMRKQRRRSASR